jgi:hypothetical protein
MQRSTLALRVPSSEFFGMADTQGTTELKGHGRVSRQAVLADADGGLHGEGGSQWSPRIRLGWSVR